MYVSPKSRNFHFSAPLHDSFSAIFTGFLSIHLNKTCICQISDIFAVPYEDIMG